MSGLFAGLMLRRQGFAVDIYERVESELAGRGAGIVAQPIVSQTLRALGSSSADLGVEATTRKILDVAGNVICELECPQTLTAWERLYRILRDGFPRRALSSRQWASRASSRDERRRHRAFQRRLERQGRRADRRRRHPLDRASATVAASLRRSTPAMWRGVRSFRKQAIPPAIHREMFTGMTFCLPPGEQFLGYPVAGPDNDLRPGHRRYNVVWYRPADERSELQRLLTDESGVTHSISIPPPLIRQEAIADDAGGRRAAGRAAVPRHRATDG